MAKQPYKKPALTLDQQVQQLIARGMIIEDRDKAKHYLGQLNYRLRAYWTETAYRVDKNPALYISLPDARQK